MTSVGTKWVGEGRPSAPGNPWDHSRVRLHFILLGEEDPVVLVKEISLGKSFLQGGACFEPGPLHGCTWPEDSAAKPRWVSKVPGRIPMCSLK